MLPHTSGSSASVFADTRRIPSHVFFYPLPLFFTKMCFENQRHLIVGAKSSALITGFIPPTRTKIGEGVPIRALPLSVRIYTLW